MRSYCLPCQLASNRCLAKGSTSATSSVMKSLTETDLLRLVILFFGTPPIEYVTFSHLSNFTPASVCVSRSGRRCSSRELVPQLLHFLSRHVHMYSPVSPGGQSVILDSSYLSLMEQSSLDFATNIFNASSFSSMLAQYSHRQSRFLLQVVGITSTGLNSANLARLVAAWGFSATNNLWADVTDHSKTLRLNSSPFFPFFTPRASGRALGHVRTPLECPHHLRYRVIQSILSLLPHIQLRRVCYRYHSFQQFI